jgi:hypothetical protein
MLPGDDIQLTRKLIMKAMKKILIAGIAAGSLVSTVTLAAVSAEEAARLGGPELTPMGAERAGNADGSIPAWEPLTTAPSCWSDGKPLCDPFSSDPILFTITAQNYSDHADKLSPGQIALLQRYPDTYKMNVYKSRRTAGYPQEVYDRIKANATTVEMVQGGNGLVNLASDAPFPIPQSGLEVIWNHIIRYRGGSVRRTYTQIPMQANGNFAPVQFQDQITFASYLSEKVEPNRLFFYKQSIQAPARLEGNVLLVHENIDQVKEPRAAWVYNAGQRRVRRAPDVAYDGPGTGSDGLRTADDLDMYNGAPDRYDWKLIGKQEMYIGSNSYKLADKSLKYKDILKPGHTNPDLLRFELRRVWVVEATLKPGARHIYARRVFFVDEDTWQIAVADLYDSRGELWRVKEAHSNLHFASQVPWYAMEVSYDLVSGRYLPIGLDNEISGYTYEWNYKASPKEYTPAALRRAGVR